MPNLEQQIKEIFVAPATKEDQDKIITDLHNLLHTAYTNLCLRKEEEASAMSLAVLYGIGKYYEVCGFNNRPDNNEIKECCLNAAYIISKIMSKLSTRSDLKILTLFELQQIAKQDTYTKYELIDMKTVTPYKGVYKFEDNWMPYNF